MIMFSEISQKLRAESNDLYRLRDALKSQCHTIQDLISGNINEFGYVFPQNLIEEILVHGSRNCRIYQPDSFGQKSAREAIADFYLKSGCRIDPDNILITPGSSLSYWYCFKLLANEGDEFLCPCPSYPLFDYIALLSGVKLTSYRLSEANDWAIDLEHLEANITTRTKAIMLISPHNPTGHVSSAEEIVGLADIACRHNLPIISDEVFSEFLIQPGLLPRPAGSPAPLVFTLNGFSKMFALPGIKFGWMAASGDPDQVRQAMRALELISDTFLPVNEIVQASASEFFQLGNAVRFEFAMRIRECWRLAEKALSGMKGITYVKPQGGFYISIRLNNMDEEQAAKIILQETHILVHPGYFYDMDPHHLILSFVQKPETIRDAFPKLMAALTYNS
jgi:alanine-synthesizing transaminase